MRDIAHCGEVERNWSEAVEDLGVSAKLWDEVIAKAFILPTGKKLPDAFLVLMRDWVQNSAERYNYVRPYGASDQRYIRFLLTQAYMDAEGDDDVLLWGNEDAIERQQQDAITAFYRNNIPGPRN